MKPIRFACVVVATVAIGVSGCGPESGDGPGTTAPASGPAASVWASVSPSDRDVVAGEVPEELLAAILADASERTGLEPDEIQVVTADRVTWNDGSLGCPEPGMMYTQALVPGYRVVVRGGSEELNFHAAESGDFRFCRDPRPPLADPNE